MKLQFHLKVRYKIILGIMLVFIVFIGISIFSLYSNYEQKSTSSLLKENIFIQNGLNDIKNIVYKDLQLTDDLIEKTNENELESKWKDHTFFVDQINTIFLEFDNYSIDGVDISGVKSIYKKQILEPYSELNKKKLKEIILSNTDSTSQDLTMVQSELLEIKKELKNNANILTLKINKNEDLIKENLYSLTNKQYDSFDNQQKRLIVMNLIAIIVLLIYIFVLMNILLQSLTKLHNYIKKLSFGIIPEENTINSNDEIGDMARNLHEFTQGVKRVAISLDEIGENKFQSTYEQLSDEDELGHSYQKMKKSLVSRNEEAQKMKEQEDIQNWSTIGIAKFGEILRQQTANNEELSYNIIKALIEYVHANQGGIFIVDDESESEPFLELMATYAYGRRKFKERRLSFGEGLVGTTALEGQSTYITNLPNDYIEIESYLGHANPSCLLLVPLKVDNKIFGIIEIASFNEFKQHEIKFIEDLAETIASTLATAKINAKTAELLEKSKEQSEAMLAQEEEMRQNLEELQSTQEEAARREKILEEELQNAHAELEKLRIDLNNIKRKQ